MIKSAFVKFDKFLHETHKAILVRMPDGKEHWIPKGLCRKFTANNKLQGSVSLPVFFIEKMGLNVNELKSDVEVIHLKPKKIMFDPNQKPDENLIK